MQSMPRPHQMTNQFRTSGVFDFESIMIYGSQTGKRDHLDWYPLTNSWTQPIYMGGALLPQRGRLSDLDVERIAALYPDNYVSPYPIMGGPNGKRSADASALPAQQATLEVIFPGVFTTTVKPVSRPTDLPNLENSTSAVKLPNPCGGECPRDMDV
jgi:hypothetical protein